MEKAIINAKLNIDQIDYINAHGTSTPFNDKNEYRQFKIYLKIIAKI